MPAFVRIDLYDKLACQASPTLLGTLYDRDLLEAKDILAIDDQEGLIFAFSKLNAAGDVRPFATNVAVRKIARVVWDDGSFDERRIALVEDARGDNGGLVTVNANPLILDLAEAADSSTGKGFVSSVANCLRVFDFSATGLTPTQVIDTYVIPNCPSWVARGTVDPTTVIPALAWNRLTPLALATNVRDTLRRMNVTCELRLRRNGTTDYKLDLVTQIGAGATVPVFHPRSNMTSLRRQFDAQQQATRLFVIGEDDPSGFPGIPGRARWKITNVDGANKRLTLADPNGGAGPIGMNSQLVNAYALRVLTGRTFQVQASSFANQTIDLLDVSTFVTGEYIEFRYSEPGTNTAIGSTTAAATRYAISAVGSLGANWLRLSGSPISVDDQYNDWYAQVWDASIGGSVVGTPQRIDDTMNANDDIHVTSTSGFTTSHFVQFIQLDGAGEIPPYLEHATFVQAPPSGYGVKIGDLGVSNVKGVTQLVKNPWMRDYSNPASVADGYALVAGTVAQNTNTDFTRYGGSSMFIANITNVQILSPFIYPSFAPGNTVVSCRLQVYFATFSATASLTMSLHVSAGGTNTIGQIALVSVSAPSTAPGAWVTMEIVNATIPAIHSAFGLVVKVVGATSGGGAGSCYIDTLEVYQAPANPETIYEYGDAVALHQSANRQLVKNASPPVTYALQVMDYEREQPSEYARNQLTIGGDVRAVDSDFGVDTTVRLLRLERDLLRPKQSTLGLSNLPALLTQNR